MCGDSVQVREREDIVRGGLTGLMAIDHEDKVGLV